MSVLGGGEQSTSCSSCFVSGEEPQYSLNRRLGGPQSQSGWFWRREKSPTPAGVQTQYCPAHSFVTTQTTQSRHLSQLKMSPNLRQRNCCICTYSQNFSLFSFLILSSWNIFDICWIKSCYVILLFDGSMDRVLTITCLLSVLIFSWTISKSGHIS